MVSTPAEGERRKHRGQFWPDRIAADQVLSADGGEGKSVVEAAATAIPRRPAIVRGFAFMGHGSRLPRDQSVKRLGWDNPATPDANGAKSASRNVSVNRRPA